MIEAVVIEDARYALSGFQRHMQVAYGGHLGSFLLLGYSVETEAYFAEKVRCSPTRYGRIAVHRSNQPCFTLVYEDFVKATPVYERLPMNDHNRLSLNEWERVKE